MTNWARVEDGKVTQVLVVERESKKEEVLWLITNLGGQWVESDPNAYAGKTLEGVTAQRFNAANVGFTYDKKHDAFVPPKPNEEASLDLKTMTWIVAEKN